MVIANCKPINQPVYLELGLIEKITRLTKLAIRKWIPVVSQPSENVCFRLSAKMSDFGDSHVKSGHDANLWGIDICHFR